MIPKNEDRAATSIPAEAIAELAESGSICPDCGGLHISRIEVAIIALNAARESGVSIPNCRCADCKTCGPFRTAVREVMSVAHPHRTWSAE